MKKRIPGIICLIIVIAALIVPTFSLNVAAAGELTFIVPEGVTVVENAEGLPGVSNETYEKDGVIYTFAGWVENEIKEETTEKPTIYDTDTAYSGNAPTLHAVYMRNEAGGTAESWNLVKDSSTLAVGDKVVIAAKDYAFAMSTNQKSNNRGQEAITKGENPITDISADVQELTLSAGNKEGTYAFYTGSGYLYAASSSSNYLRTETTLSDNSSWTISIDAEGVATVKAQGANTRNVLQYNSSSKIFSCYTSGQADIVLYKLTSTSVSSTYYATFSPEAVLPEFTATFVVPEGATNVESIKGSSIEMPSADVPTGNYSFKYTFVGWVEDTVDEATTAAPTFHAAGAIVDLTGDKTFYALYNYADGATEATYKSLSEMDNSFDGKTVLILSQKGTSSNFYALSNENGTSKAPNAVDLGNNLNNISPDEINKNIKWYLEIDGSNYSFYTSSKKESWLYCTDTNNGVRVGTNTANIFTIDESNYFKHTGTGRFLGVYNSQDWRCYTAPTATNIKDQTFYLYVPGEAGTTYYTTTLVSPESCTHTSQTTETEEATCTKVGHTRVVCNECRTIFSDTRTEALGHNYSAFVTTVPAECEKEGTKEKTCSRCGDVRTEAITALGHNYGDDHICTGCGQTDPDSIDYSGRYYIAVSRKDGNHYIINELTDTSTKRYNITSALDASLPSSITSSPDSRLVFVFEKNSDGTYLIYAEGIAEDAKYLGWNSGNSGAFVKKEDAKHITVIKNDSTGAYTLSFPFQTETRYLSVNNTTGNDYAAWYTSVQKGTSLSLIPIVSPSTSITGATMTLGTSLSMNYSVALPEGAILSEYSMKFTFCGIETTVSGVEDNGEYIFIFNGIGPHQLGDNIRAELLHNGETVASKDDYSGEAYLRNILADNSGDTALANLVNDLLAYGRASQEYLSYSTDKLVEAGTPTYTPAENTDKTNSGAVDGQPKIVASGVRFDYVNKIYFKFSAESTNGVVIKIDGNEVSYELAEDGNYIVYTDAILATDFDKVFTLVISVDGADIQTVTYSINAYAFAKFKDNGTAVSNLAHALYSYGKSAEEYKTASV